jgi:ACS family hexuronate transporter-like MFS transporter
VFSCEDAPFVAEAEPAPDSPTAVEPSAGSAWTLAVVATLTMSVSYIDRQTLAVIAPSVTKALDIDNAHYGWLVSAFSIAYLVFAPLAGHGVDRLGARWGMAAALFTWSIVAGLHALAWSFGSLFVLRLLLGMTEAPSFPSAAQAIRRSLSPNRQPLAIGLLFTGSSFGSVIAAKVAVRLEAAYGFRGAFLATAAIGALWLPAWLAATRGHGLDRGAKVTPAQEPKPRLGGAATLGVLVSAPVLRAVIAVIGCAPSIMFVLNWTAKYLVDGWGMPKDSIANYLVVAPVAFDVGALGFGWLQSRREPTTASAPLRPTHRDLVFASMLCVTALAFAPLMPSPELAVAILALSAFGGGGMYVLVTTDMLARVPLDRASVAGGMTAAAQSLSHVIVAPLVGWTIDRTHAYGAALVGLGLVALPACLVFALWPGMSSAKSVG